VKVVLADWHGLAARVREAAALPLAEWVAESLLSADEAGEKLEPPSMLREGRRVAEGTREVEGLRVLDKAGEMLEPPSMLWEGRRVAEGAREVEGVRVLDKAGEMLEPPSMLREGMRVAEGAREVEGVKVIDLEHVTVKVPSGEREVVQVANGLLSGDAVGVAAQVGANVMPGVVHREGQRHKVQLEAPAKEKLPAGQRVELTEEVGQNCPAGHC
jgi:hypothetical protein